MVGGQKNPAEEEEAEEEELRLLHPSDMELFFILLRRTVQPFSSAQLLLKADSGNTSTHSTSKQKNLQTFNQNRSIAEPRSSCGEQPPLLSHHAREELMKIAALISMLNQRIVD